MNPASTVLKLDPKPKASHCIWGCRPGQGLHPFGLTCLYPSPLPIHSLQAARAIDLGWETEACSPIASLHTPKKGDRLLVLGHEVLRDLTLLDLLDLKLFPFPCLPAQLKLCGHCCRTSGPLHLPSLCTAQSSSRPPSGSFLLLLKCHLSEVFSDQPT